MNAASKSVAVIGEESCSKEYKHSDPLEEPTPADPYLHEIPLDAELGRDNAIQSAKASKRHPRWNSRTLKEVQETRSKVTRHAAVKRKVKKDKKLTDATNDHQCLTDVTRATEPGSGTKSKKRKNSERNMRAKLLGSEVAPNQFVMHDTDVAVSMNLDQPADSYRDTDVQCKRNAAAMLETEDIITPASVLKQSRVDTTCPPSLLVYSRRKRKRSSQVYIGSIGSSNGAASILDQCERRETGEGTYSKQMMVVEEGSRNEDKAYRNKASEVEAEDDCSLAHFYSKLKKRRTEKPELQGTTPTS